MIGQRGQVERLAWLDRYECCDARAARAVIEGKSVALPDAYAQASAKLRERFADRASEARDAAGLATGA